MDSKPSKKCKKKKRIDRISSMPDSILGVILSYLSTREAVATSILSTRWKNLFPYAITHINLDLNDRVCSGMPRPNVTSQSTFPSFVNFVDKLLNETLLHVPCVEKISFYCGKKYDNGKIVSWVRAAIRLNVVYLKLLVIRVIDTKALFSSLNGCGTLVELEFESKSDLVLPEEEFVLPNVKRMCLCLVSPCEDSIHKLLDGCPLLEDLSIRSCNLRSLDYFCIQSLLLKRLFIKDCLDEEGSVVAIDAPNLEAFVYDGNLVANYVSANFNTLHSASIGINSFIDEDYVDFFGFKLRRLGKLLNACSRTTHLCISGKFTADVHRAPHASLRLPKFENLTCLTLGRKGSHGFKLLAQLLKSAPSLQTLTIEQGLKNCKGQYAIFESSLPTLPVCLELCFKKIVLWQFLGEEDEIKFIEYFLKNGKVLEEVYIHCLHFVDKSVFNRLLMLPRHSPTCQILMKESYVYFS